MEVEFINCRGLTNAAAARLAKCPQIKTISFWLCAGVTMAV